MTNQKPTCLSCKKQIKGIAISFYGKDACLNCYNSYKNNKNIINK